MMTLAGLATARGFAVGPVFLYRGDGEVAIPEYAIEFGCEGEELLRLRRAISEAKRDLQKLISVLRERTGRSDVRVFECHLMLLEDAMLLAETEGHIARGHLNAEAAVRKTAAGARALFDRMNDPYFRERVRDLDDVERRLIKALVGFSANPTSELRVPSIIVADDLSPSETVQLPREYVLGFATNGGSTTSHVALLARALGIPAVSGLGNVTEKVRPGGVVLLDGTNGAITIDADETTSREFRVLVERQRDFTKAVASSTKAGALKDGGDVCIYANVHPGVPVAGVREFGARGIGLYRSEYLWLDRELEPTEDEQFRAYCDAAKFTVSLSDSATITIRTLDIGGDKTVRGISQKEANPFLGNRSIRYLLSNRDVFRTQLRAILRASGCVPRGRVYVMYPMISCLEEIREARRVLDEVKRNLADAGVPFDPDIPVGAMIEVPAAALIADDLAREVDFFSIGTNDLVQYVMASDRGNKAVSHLYQPTHPAVIRLVRMTVDAARAHGIKVGVCGESASDPIVGLLWAAYGVNMLSMSPTYIPVMAKLFERLTRSDLDEYVRLAESMTAGHTAEEIFNACHDWLAKKIPDLGDLLI